MTETGGAATNFEGPLGGTANPVRMIYMLGAVWRLSQSLGPESIRILEIGSWTGLSALAWADAVFQNNMRSLPDTVTLEVHRGWSRDVLPTLEAEAYDLVYIDGDHSYAAVRADIADAMKLVRSGGILCGDDLELQLQDGVADISADKPRIDEIYEPERKVWYHPGVTKAVGEVFGAVSAWFGFWAMQKRKDCWQVVDLDGMPIRIPRHIPPKTMFAMKKVMMELGLI